MALDDLRAAVEEAHARYAEPGRAARWEKAALEARRPGVRRQSARLVEVRAGDVAAAAGSVADPDDVVQALLDGCSRGRPGRTVLVDLDHLERLVKACSA